MKIKKDLFSAFVRETALSGEHALKEVKMDFAEKGVTVKSNTEGNAAMVIAQIPAVSFEDYAEIGKIAILDYTELQKIIGTLNEDITIKKEGNLLVLSGGRKVEVPLADESAIKDIEKVPKLEYPYSFVVNKKFFDEIQNNLVFSLNKSDTATVEFTGAAKKLTARYGTKYKFEDSLIVDSITDDEMKVNFGAALLNVVSNITGDLQIEMKANYPMTITKRTDMYALKVIVAPKSA